ncbi:hypothetical protein [Nocardioides panzhihuensis]|uniref:Uncharacterized protein n=1 Tax=Nocardioides panzhihuensis TaxID=860243 RepID=A0A7Z0IUK9_9ACTN|nr:hypothetical protein [Nocardioides panzhihuensis]NYI79923.1 hypothetical protein [Nocardioides panzhihuensis]
MASPARRLARQLLPERLRQSLTARVPSISEGAPEGVKPAPISIEVEPLVVAADLDGAVNAAGGGFYERAWALFQGVPVEKWAVSAADEYVMSGLHVDPDATRATLRELAESGAAYVPGRAWLAMTSRVFGFGDQELARSLYARLDEAVGDGTNGDTKWVVESRDWLRSWVAADNDEPDAPAAPEGTVSYAVVDYGHPGRSRASANIGDHVQTVASLGHLVRHRDLEFTGESELDELADRLRERVRPERVRDGLSAKVQLLTLQRDASMYQPVPKDTWMLGFGWYMHPIFEMRYGMPFHKNLRPIFVSFHCSTRAMMTDETIEYLKKYAPIGCRDWTTVDILLSVGVPAFFSGCLTTTVSTVFPDATELPGPDAPVGYVDVFDGTIPEGAPTYAQGGLDEVRFRPFVKNIDDAITMLEGYRRDHRKLVTSRLHCYLPGRSIGIDIDFRPKNLSDPRFAGLNPLTPEEFDGIRESMNDRLETILTKIFSGASVEEVYAQWSEMNAAEVEIARQRRAGARKVGELVSSIADDVRSNPVHTPEQVPADAIHVAVSARPKQRPKLRRLIKSIAAYSSRPVHLWVQTGGTDLRLDELARPGITLSALDVSGFDGIKQPDGSTLPIGQLERLVVADLLPDVDRLVILPVSAVLTEDIAGLADTDLEGNLLAAADVVGTRGVSGFQQIHAAANKQAERTTLAAELRRDGHQRHAFDFDAFDIDVLVLDAAQWREKGLLASLAPYVETYGMTYRNVVLLEVGPHRAVLPERWNAIPGKTSVAEPALARLA